MNKTTANPWDGAAAVSEDTVRSRFLAEGLTPSRWSNGPGDRYGIHSHSYHKVLYCIHGNITFEVESTEVRLNPGDRLEIPPNTPHSATVGPEGVVCMEAPRH